MNMEKWLCDYAKNNDPSQFHDEQNHIYMTRVQGKASIESEDIRSKVLCDRETLRDAIGYYPGGLKKLCADIREKLASSGTYEIRSSNNKISIVRID